jgi:ADP-ribosylglycohydrolase/fructose-1,6-bisphosphatase/inositol monophosphatase family enzyme
MPRDLKQALALAVSAAREAGERLRADLHRPDGPRGAGDKAGADTEAEWLIRERLLRELPGSSFLGEETGREAGRPGEPLWLVDPNDGTRDYLRGRRGSAVSIALLVDARPALGVVFAFSYPDDGGDLFAWAEGCGPVTRNGRPATPLEDRPLGAHDVVLVSSAGDSDPTGISACVTPARFRAVPSIAHRLALVAAGEAAAAVSLNFPSAWDYAGGHALLRGAGARLLDEQGRAVGYAPDGESRCVCAFAGARPVVETLLGRPWHTLGLTPSGTGPGVGAGPARGALVRHAGRLSRAQGALLGQVAGDSLGALVEFETAAAIAAREPDGPRRLENGGRWDLLAGQPTDDSELALALARSILAEGGFEREAALEAYRAWLRSQPFDVGDTIGAALRDHPNPASQANGSLMRASPLGIYAHALAPPLAAELARQDASLTHPSPVCGDATAAYVVAIAHAVNVGDGAEAAWRAASAWAEAHGAALLVREALQAARDDGPPVCDQGSEGWVKIALQTAFFELLHAESLEAGVVATVRRGGDTDTNAAIAGALLGAVHGREAVPLQWRSMVLSCRPLAPRARRPRPQPYWPVDVLQLAEGLLGAGERGRAATARGRE